MHIRTNGQNINFDDKNILKSEFHKNKKVFQIYNIDATKILISKIESYGTKNTLKYFITYNDNDVIRPLCLRLQQMTCYTKKFNENATISLGLIIINNFQKITTKYGQKLKS